MKSPMELLCRQPQNDFSTRQTSLSFAPLVVKRNMIGMGYFISIINLSVETVVIAVLVIGVIMHP